MQIEIVSPVYNEQACITQFLLEIESTFKSINLKNPEIKLRLILIDDGSTDNSVNIIKNSKIEVPLLLLELARNYGHQNALWAGLENVGKDSYAIVLDSDLQDPPTEISRIVEEFVLGNEIVLMRRETRKDSPSKKLFAKLFYKIQWYMTQGSILSNVGDFFGISPIARQALLAHHEKIKYIRGLVAQLGFKRIVLDYHRQARVAGITHYKPAQMISLAIASLTGFSTAPLIWTVGLSLIGFCLGVVIIFYILYLKFLTTLLLPAGWAFATIVLLVMSIFQMIVLAILSLYIARVIQEQKDRPIFFVARSWERN
jgi:glycosyltransferase involved in cell wall biosynthesis